MEELKEEQNITDNENVPLVKKKRVINAPRSEKQIEAFKKAQQKRDENREKMKKEKEVKMAQIYFENKLKQENEKPKEIDKPKEKQISKKPVMKYEESESESEEEIIYVKKKPPKQKNKKLFIYQMMKKMNHLNQHQQNHQEYCEMNHNKNQSIIFSQ